MKRREEGRTGRGRRLDEGGGTVAGEEGGGRSWKGRKHEGGKMRWEGGSTYRDQSFHRSGPMSPESIHGTKRIRMKVGLGSCFIWVTYGV